MIKYLLSVLIKEIIEAVTKMASDYIKLQKKKKEDKVKVNEAVKTKNPQERAKRIRDLLS